MNRSVRGAAAATLAVAGIAAAAIPAQAARPGSADPITISFSSYAFQEPTVDATNAIVDAWNEANPDVQVELVLTSAETVHDELVTQFAGGTAPDIIHDESADILGFAEQGYLADLTPYLSDDVKADVSEGIWSAVTASDGSIVAAPTLLQSYVVFANTDAIEAAGLEVPSGDTLAWDDFETLANGLTGDDHYGLGWGLRSPTATMLNLSLGFGGDYFTIDGDDISIEVGDAELAVPQRIHDLAYVDNALDPVSLTLSGGDALPGFIGGDYALYVAGDYVAQQLVAAAPADFNWTVLPPLAGSESAAQAANPQTLSVSADSEHPEEAAAFINFVMGAENLASLAQGDWLIPSSTSARASVQEATGGENGWDQILASGEQLIAAPFQFVPDYPQWKDQIATPAFQQYLADAISLDDLATQLTDGWDQVSGG